MLEPCPLANEGCKYFNRHPRGYLAETENNGCYSDLDHIVPQRLATTALRRAYIDLPLNHQQLCRTEHDAKTAAGDAPLPSEYEMALQLKMADYRREIELEPALKQQIIKILGQQSLKASGIEAGDDLLAVGAAN